MKKILFPTDFSEAAKNGFNYALSFAKEINATVDVISIYSINYTAIEGAPPKYIQDLIDSEKQKVEKGLKDFVASGELAFSGATRAIYGVFIPEEIISLVKNEQYDLIVMGTKGERNQLEKLIGSITTRTMMNAPCPVLAIPESAKYKDIQTITYATDFKSKDKIAVEQLRQFSKITESKLTFTHVQSEPLIGDFNETITLDHYPFEETDFHIINNSSIMIGLNEFIEQNGIDMLALFIPKRRLWEQLFHSSFSKKYAFHTHVPLLVFHE